MDDKPESDSQNEEHKDDDDKEAEPEKPYVEQNVSANHNPVRVSNLIYCHSLTSH